MNWINAALIISSLNGIYQTALVPHYSQSASGKSNLLIAGLTSTQEDSELPLEFNESICRSMPVGVGIPGFQPGINRSDILRMFGTPTGMTSGYWPNTRAMFYELIPNQVSLGFLVDSNSGRLRQTEAAFAKEIDSQVMMVTVNGMLGCRINEPIKQGLQQVWQRQARRYSFSIGSLKGLIERDNRDRVYVGIWEVGLH